MIDALRLLYIHRHMILSTSMIELRGRYSGSTLGLAWAAIYPVLFLAMYSVVYTVVLRVRLEQHTSFEYVLIIFCGLIPFIGFSEALSASTQAVISNKGLLKNTIFPVELLPVKSVLVSQATMAVGLVSLFIALLVVGRLSFVQLMIFPVIILQLVFSVGLGWVIATLAVFFRDIVHIMGVIVLFLMLVSPIGYTHSMIPASILPLMYPNPLYYIIDLYREILFFHVVPWISMGVLTVCSVAMFTLGWALIHRLKPVFSDYV